MKRLLCVACWLACFTLLAATALAAAVTDVEVLEYGLYTYDEKVVVMENRDGTAKLSNIRQLRETLDIPVGDKTFFSIKYVLQTEGKTVPVDIELRVTTPEGKTSTGSLEAYTGVPTTTNIEFTEHDAAGTYLFQVLQEERVLLSRKINLVKP